MKKIIKLIIFAIFIAGFIYFGTLTSNDKNDKNKKGKKDSDKYYGSAYVFESINHSKLLSKLSSKNQDMIIYACFEDSKLCDSYGELINDVSRYYDINEIYYYDFKVDKKEKNATYQKITNKLSEYLVSDDFGNQDLYAPTLIFVKNGYVYEFDDSLTLRRGKNSYDTVLSDEELNLKRNYLMSIMEGYKSNE